MPGPGKPRSKRNLPPVTKPKPAPKKKITSSSGLKATLYGYKPSGARKKTTPAYNPPPASPVTTDADRRRASRTTRQAAYADKDNKFKDKKDRRIQKRALRLKRVLGPDAPDYQVGKLAKEKTKPAALERGLFTSIAKQQEKVKKRLDDLSDRGARDTVEQAKAKQLREASARNESELERLKSRQFDRAARQTTKLLKKRKEQGATPEVLKDIRKYKNKLEDKSIVAKQREEYHKKIANKRLEKFEQDYQALTEKRQKIKEATSVQDLINAGVDVVSVATGKPGRERLYDSPAVKASGATVPYVSNDPYSPVGTVTIRNDAGEVRRFKLEEDEKLSALDIALFLAPIPIGKLAVGGKALKAALAASRGGKAIAGAASKAKTIPGIAATGRGLRSAAVTGKTAKTALLETKALRKAGQLRKAAGAKVAKARPSGVSAKRKAYEEISRAHRAGEISDEAFAALTKAYNRRGVRGYLPRKKVAKIAKATPVLERTHFQQLAKRYTIPQRTLLGVQRVPTIAVKAAKHPIGTYVIGASAVGAARNPEQQLEDLKEFGGGMASLFGDGLNGAIDIEWDELPDKTVNAFEAAYRLSERLVSDGDFRSETFKGLFEAGSGMVILPFYLTHETITAGPTQVIDQMATMVSQDLNYRWGPAFNNDWELFMDRAEESGGAAWYYLDLWPAMAASSWAAKSGAVLATRGASKLGVPTGAAERFLLADRPGLAIAGGTRGVRQLPLSNRFVKTGKQRAFDYIRERKTTKRVEAAKKAGTGAAPKELALTDELVNAQFAKVIQPLWDGKIQGQTIPVITGAIGAGRERRRLSKRTIGQTEMRHQDFIRDYVRPAQKLLAGRRFRDADGKIRKGLSKKQQQLMPYMAWIVGKDAEIFRAIANDAEITVSANRLISILESHKRHMLSFRRVMQWEDTSVPLKSFEIEVIDDILDTLRNNPKEYFNNDFKAAVDRYVDILSGAEKLDPSLAKEVATGAVYKTQLEYLRKRERRALHEVDRINNFTQQVIYDIFEEMNPDFPKRELGESSNFVGQPFSIQHYRRPQRAEQTSGTQAETILERVSNELGIRGSTHPGGRVGEIVTDAINDSIKQPNPIEQHLHEQFSIITNYADKIKEPFLKELSESSHYGLGPDQLRTIMTAHMGSKLKDKSIVPTMRQLWDWAQDRHRSFFHDKFKPETYASDGRLSYWEDMIKSMGDEVYRVTQEWLKDKGYSDHVLVYRGAAQSQNFDFNKPMAFSLSPVDFAQQYLPIEAYLVKRSDILYFRNALNKSGVYTDELEVGIIPDKAVKLGTTRFKRSPIGNPRGDIQMREAKAMLDRINDELNNLDLENYKPNPPVESTNKLAKKLSDGTYHHIEEATRETYPMGYSRLMVVWKHPNGKAFINADDLRAYAERFGADAFEALRYKDGNYVARGIIRSDGGDELPLFEVNYDSIVNTFAKEEFDQLHSRIMDLRTEAEQYVNSLRDKNPIGNNPWIDHLVNIEHSRIQRAAKDSGLGDPFYYASRGLEDLPYEIEEMVKNYKESSFVGKEFDIPPTELASKEMLLFRLGLQDLNPEIQVANLLQKSYRIRDFDRLQSMITDAGISVNDAIRYYDAKGLTLPKSFRESLDEDLIGRGSFTRNHLIEFITKSGGKASDYTFINQTKLNKLLDQIDEAVTLKETRGILGFRRERHEALKEVLEEATNSNEKGRWVAVHNDFMKPILNEFGKFDNNVVTTVWDMPKALASRLLLAPNLSWLQFQVFANASLAGVAGVGPRSWIEAQQVYRKAPLEVRQAMDHAMGVQTHHLDISKMNANLANFWHHWLTKSYGYRRHLEGRNFLDAFFFVDRKNNQFFRRAVLYNEMKKETYKRLNGHSSRLLNTMNRIMKKHNNDDFDAMFASISKDRKLMDELAKNMESFMGDYLNFSVLERQLMQRSVMFYGFLRHSLQFTLKTLPIDHPVRMGLLATLSYQAIEDSKAALGVKDLDHRLLGKFYLDGPIDIPLLGRVEPSDNGLLEIDLARASVVGNFFVEAFSAPNTEMRLIASSNPVWIPFFEASTGLNFYTGTPLRGSQNPEISWNHGSWGTWFGAKGRYVLNRELETFFRPYRILGQATAKYPPWRKGADSMALDERPYKYSAGGDAINEAERDIKKFQQQQEGGFLSRPVQTELFPFLPAPTSDPELIKFLKKQDKEPKPEVPESFSNYEILKGVDDTSTPETPPKLVPGSRRYKNYLKQQVRKDQGYSILK